MNIVGSKSSASWRFPLLLGLLLTVASASTAVGQKRFTPEHPEVKAMADKAANYLRPGGDVGPATLASIAIVQYHKRYNERVPKDHPGILSTIGKIQAMYKGGGERGPLIFRQNECYFPALAVMLFCEFDPVKYKSEIEQLLDMFVDRQMDNGAFTYLGQSAADTSQTQFACLAMWVAKQKGFDVDLDMAQKTLNWLCRVHAGSGQWSYRYSGFGSPQSGSTLSMQAAGISSVYLMADMLQLYGRRKDMAKSGAAGEIGLPRTVNIYIPREEGAKARKDGPLVNFDRGLLTATSGAGNRSLAARFSYDIQAWNYYYLYALERYAYFREQAEGNPGNGFGEWYDNGIDFLKKEQSDDGRFPAYNQETSQISTAFALLFMVRSSQLVVNPPAISDMNGGSGFAKDSTLRDEGNGRMGEIRPEESLQDMLDMLKEDDKATREQLERINEALKKQIVEFRKKDSKSKGEIKSFLRSMVGAKDYYRRLIAVRFLAAEQDMDNVPALIYALSDPDLRVAIEAHDGLRLVSRKIDSMKLSPASEKNARRDPDRIKAEKLEDGIRKEFKIMEDRWTEWYLKIRPGAELLGKSGKGK